MCRLHLSLSCLIVGGLVCFSSQDVRAQSPDDNTGIVRVTDCADNLSPDSGGEPLYGVGSGAACPPGGGHCPGHHGHHGHLCNKGPHCQHLSLTAYRILDWFNPHGIGTHSPDHGWAPPAKRPIYRADVVYNKMYPDAWTGQSSTAPQMRVPTVYMPTDTTQLGYYYQKVPYWQPSLGAIPPAPTPSQWHVSLCEVPGTGPHPAGVIFGTAPRVAPAQSGSPSGEHVVNPQGTLTSPTPAAPVDDLPPSPLPAEGSNLEKPAASPNLLPVRP